MGRMREIATPPSRQFAQEDVLQQFSERVRAIMQAQPLNPFSKMEMTVSKDRLVALGQQAASNPTTLF